MNKAKGCFITILIFFIIVVIVVLCILLSGLNATGKNMLILGIDKRPGSSDLTDTIIIYHISEWGEKDSLISIPRDTRVYLDGFGWNKINASYLYGGEEMIENEIYELTGIETYKYIVVDFTAFKEIVDILGGVEIVVEEHLHDPLSEADFDPGTYNMSGEQALSFARCRATAGGDFDRIARQQYLISEIIKQKFNFSMIGKAPQIIGIINSYTVTDFTIWDFCSIGFVLLFSGGDMNHATIPTVSEYIDNLSFQIADEEEVKEFLVDYLK